MSSSGGPDACANTCDGRPCGSLPCDILAFYRVTFGAAQCELQTSDGCACTVFECDSCGNGVIEADEDCDLGGTCAAGPEVGMPCTFGQCGVYSCEPRGGQGCAANCTNETMITATVQPGPYRVNVGGRATVVSLTGPIVFAEGKPWFPPSPPCLPAAIRSFAAQPVSAPDIGCVCARGIEDPLLYGPGNVGAGCVTDANTLQAALTLQTWVIAGGCEPGQPDDGPDGYPCTADDPGRQNAAVSQTDFACAGDCDANGAVTIDEIVKAVNLALDSEVPYACPSLLRNGGTLVTVDEIVSSVGNALQGCTSLTLE